MVPLLTKSRTYGILGSDDGRDWLVSGTSTHQMFSIFVAAIY